jgi:hypothetical protein
MYRVFVTFEVSKQFVLHMNHLTMAFRDVLGKDGIFLV